MNCILLELSNDNTNSSTMDSNNISASTTWETNDTHVEAFRDEEQWYKDAEYILARYVTHYICLFGIIGNLINLIVLTRKSLTAHMERMEKSSHVGLIALAVSDCLYCLCSFPQVYKEQVPFGSPSIGFWLVYSTYGMACINCFLLSSSWLTVAMAVCRYLAICHPLHARQFLGMTASRIIITVVFLLSIIFNLPRFWMKQIACVEYSSGEREYFQMPGYIESNDTANITYMWLYFIFGILLPLLVLAYCNIFLVKALHESSRLRNRHSSSKPSSSEATRIVTLTLCVIVIMYIVLVGPAELVTFWRPFVTMENLLQYGLAVKICNALQMFNFAVNFILYCIINVHFRKVIRDLLLCQLIREQISSHGQTRSGFYSTRGGGKADTAML